MTDEELKDIQRKVSEAEDDVRRYVWNRIDKLEKETGFEVCDVEYDIDKKEGFLVGSTVPFHKSVSHNVRITLQVPR